MMTRRAFLFSVGSGLCLGSAAVFRACGSPKAAPATPVPPTTVIRPSAAARSRQVTSFPVRFTDVTAAAGIGWQFNNGAEGINFFIEQTGGGVAFLDYNHDGLLDIFAVQGGPVPGAGTPAGRFSTRNVLYRNDGDGTFTDVTREAGLDVQTGYGQGVSVADYDNDGWPDIYVTAYGGNHLFHNNGNGTFQEVTQKAGLGPSASPEASSVDSWATSSAWADYDNDGHLDLYVCHYCRWSVPLDPPNGMRQENNGNPAPVLYEPTHSRLYHNNGDGTFTDVTVRAGLSELRGKSLSAAWIDYDEDGWLDLFVANDTMPNFLLHNNRDGTFTNRAAAAGVALSPSGLTTASMGIGIFDYRNEGREDIFVSNFSGEPKTVWHNAGRGVFEDGVQKTRIAATNRRYLGFGVECFDYDLDGFPDVIVGNGHVVSRMSETNADGETYAQSQQLLHNERDGTFVEDLRSLGDLVLPRVTRGLAVGDYDNDGDVDVLMVSQAGPLQLYRNDGGNRNHWITFRLEGVHSNRDAVGARVTVNTEDGRQTQWVKGGSSYCSHSDLRLTFGLGRGTKIRALEIRWPRGLRQRFGALEADRFYLVREALDPMLDPRLSKRAQTTSPL